MRRGAGAGWVAAGCAAGWAGVVGGAAFNIIGTDGSDDSFNANERNVVSGNSFVGILINGAMMLVLSLVTSWLGLQETFNVNGFPDTGLSLDTIIAAILGAIITGIVAAIAGHFVPDRR